MTDMAFRQLDYFIAAVQCGTFLGTTEALHISQPALPRQFVGLEKGPDIQLWDRNRRSAVLTRAGHMFYEEALNLPKECCRTLFRISEFKEKASQRLSIDIPPILSQYHLTAMLRDFVDNHPLIHVFLEEVEEYGLLQGFSNDAHDLIITHSNMLDSKIYAFLLLAEGRPVAVLPGNHRPVDRFCISLSDIAGEGSILIHSYTPVYRFCMGLSQKVGTRPHLLRTTHMEFIISVVAIREGISLLPGEDLRLFQYKDIVSISIDPADRLSIDIAGKRQGQASSVMVESLHYTKDYTR